MGSCSGGVWSLVCVCSRAAAAPEAVAAPVAPAATATLAPAAGSGWEEGEAAPAVTSVNVTNVKVADAWYDAFRAARARGLSHSLSPGSGAAASWGVTGVTAPRPSFRKKISQRS